MELIVAKGIGLLLLFLIPITMGSLPFCLPLFPFIKKRLQHLNTRCFFSYLSCFAGGFFLGTSLLVVLGQGLAKFESYRHLVSLEYTFPFFEVSIGAGFFLVALTEKLTHIFCKRRAHRGEAAKKAKEDQKTEEMARKSLSTLNESDDDPYEIPDNMDAASTKTILSLSDIERGQSSRSQNIEEPERGSGTFSSDNHVQYGREDGQDGSFDAARDERGEGGGGGSVEKTRRSEENDPSEFSLLRVLLLVLALSFHTIFDGLTLGLLTEVSQVVPLMIALGVHKAIMSFVLGVELASVFADRKLSLPLFALFLYSLASPLGVAVGIGITSVNVRRSVEHLTGAVLQAVATGVFLYVTCYEILARDMVARQDRPLLRVAIALLGFVVIMVLEVVVAYWD